MYRQNETCVVWKTHSHTDMASAQPLTKSTSQPRSPAEVSPSGPAYKCGWLYKRGEHLHNSSDSRPSRNDQTFVTTVFGVPHHCPSRSKKTGPIRFRQRLNKDDVCTSFDEHRVNPDYYPVDDRDNQLFLPVQQSCTRARWSLFLRNEF